MDIDLEKFFDRVNHDRLMAAVAKRVEDKRLLRLIRAFLNAGVMENGLVSPTDEGTPQGGPLSPLLSNLVLDEWDRELEKRGHRFVRYADDCNIYVRSERAGQRVMESMEHFIAKRLRLKVNGAKSAVARPWERKFLGFTFTVNRQPKRRVASKALARFTRKVRELTRRTRGISVQERVEQLATYLRGWRGYFGFCQTPSVLDEWDRELEKRGHRFVRYADDCNIYVRSERAGRRVMEGVERFVTRRLRLKVNAAKSAVARPWERTFLGFTFTRHWVPRRRVSPKALARFTRTVRGLTRRTRGVSVQAMVEQLSPYLRGWGAHFGCCQTPTVLAALNSWIHRRLRGFLWKQWKRGRRRFAQLRRLGVGKNLAAQSAGSPHGPWRLSRSPALSYALPDAFWDGLGLPRLAVR